MGDEEKRVKDWGPQRGSQVMKEGGVEGGEGEKRREGLSEGKVASVRDDC